MISCIAIHTIWFIRKGRTYVSLSCPYTHEYDKPIQSWITETWFPPHLFLLAVLKEGQITPTGQLKKTFFHPSVLPNKEPDKARNRCIRTRKLDSIGGFLKFSKNLIFLQIRVEKRKSLSWIDMDQEVHYSWLEVTPVCFVLILIDSTIASSYPVVSFCITGLGAQPIANFGAQSSQW